MPQTSPKPVSEADLLKAHRAALKLEQQHQAALAKRDALILEALQQEGWSQRRIARLLELTAGRVGQLAMKNYRGKGNGSES